MKDYRLSEIKACCKTRVGKYPKPCNDCEMKAVCQDTLPLGWDIEPRVEPRDTVELPCKEHRVNDYGDVWDVYYRDERYGFVRHECRGTEAEADEFLAELKGGKQ